MYIHIHTHPAHLTTHLLALCVGIQQASPEPRVCQYYPFVLILRWSQFQIKSKSFENLLQADMLCADGAARLAMFWFVQ